MHKLLLILPASFFFIVNVFASVEIPSACDCDTLIVSEEEAKKGCPSHVKERTCPLYRESEVMKERLRKQQESRELEKDIQPRF